MGSVDPFLVFAGVGGFVGIAANEGARARAEHTDTFYFQSLCLRLNISILHNQFVKFVLIRCFLSVVNINAFLCRLVDLSTVQVVPALGAVGIHSPDMLDTRRVVVTETAFHQTRC